MGPNLLLSSVAHSLDVHDFLVDVINALAEVPENTASLRKRAHIASVENGAQVAFLAITSVIKQKNKVFLLYVLFDSSRSQSSIRTQDPIYDERSRRQRRKPLNMHVI